VDQVATNALHNSGHDFDPPECHPGTRVAVIEAIMNWLAGADEDTRAKGVNWLTGAAGAGKSAIGRSICERCALEGTLLASFFFGSSDAARNHSKTLVATIAYQICSFAPSIRQAVSDFIDNDPHIFSKSLRTQFVSLVMDPLLTFYAHGTQNLRRLIVIDGLDECVDPSSQRDILETITYLITTYPYFPIRFLVCSRPESNIKNVIHGVGMSATVFTISLGDEYDAEEDIDKYLHDNFTAIREGHIFRHLIPEYWPKQTHIRTLLHKSSGQFIYASTVIRYILSSDDMPHRRLEVILGLRPPHGELPFAQLDALYLHILTMTKDPPMAAKLLTFLALYGGTLVSILARYLGLEDEEVELMLSKLVAVVASKPNEQDNNVIVFHLLHRSFEDFLFDQSRSKTLYLSREDAEASHILRSIQIFSSTPFFLQASAVIYITCNLRAHRLYRTPWRVPNQS